MLDRAIRLSDRRRGPNYYMAEDLAAALDPASRTGYGTHLGGFKPAVRCDVDTAGFESFLRERSER